MEFLKKNKLNRGFTLIELLVVIAIICLLASIVLLSLANAKNNAIYTKAAADQNAIRVALELYYEDHGDWPTVGQAVYADTTQGGGWDAINTDLEPYLSGASLPGYDTISPQQGAIDQGFVYVKGTQTQTEVIETFDSLTGDFVACLFLNDGYYVDFVLPQQSNLTLDDGGIDPDGVEAMDGTYQISYDRASCP